MILTNCNHCGHGITDRYVNWDKKFAWCAPCKRKLPFEPPEPGGEAMLDLWPGKLAVEHPGDDEVLTIRWKSLRRLILGPVFFILLVAQLLLSYVTDKPPYGFIFLLPFFLYFMGWTLLSIANTTRLHFLPRRLTINHGPIGFPFKTKSIAWRDIRGFEVVGRGRRYPAKVYDHYHVYVHSRNGRVVLAWGLDEKRLAEDIAAYLTKVHQASL